MLIIIIESTYIRHEIVNGVLIKGNPIDVVNALGELGYRVVGTTGEAEVVTMSHCKEQHSHDKCRIDTKASNVYQTLDELDFERGIWSAAQSGDLDKVADLIENGEDVNAKDAAGYTALHYAARNGHLELCKYLLAKGCDVNAVTKAGSATPLHRACSSGSHKIVEVLLHHKADVNLQDGDGKTALHRAAQAQNKEICERLIAISAELKLVRDMRDKLPADYAIDKALLEFLKE
ncbi:hypothetical protein Trydic_g14141 [Trypoxylus dichotomus]